MSPFLTFCFREGRVRVQALSPVSVVIDVACRAPINHDASVAARTFMGIAVHNLSGPGADSQSNDLAAAVRRSAAGILGTTVQFADLVCTNVSFE